MLWKTVSDTRCELGEGPTWDPGTGMLWWIDGYGKTVYAAREGDERAIARWRLDRFPIGIVLTLREEPWVVTADSIRTLEGSPVPGLPHNLLAEHGYDPAVYRFNDSFAVSTRLMIAGVMAWNPDERPGGFLHLRPGGGGRIPREIRLPNGIGLNPEGNALYLTDSLTKAIFRASYDPAREVIGPLEPFIDSTDRPGVPDGLAVAGDGTVFVARWGGSTIDRYDPSARLVETLPVPMKQPSSVTFGGPAMKTLFVTSATEGMSTGERSSTDGTTIAGEVDVAGLPETVWNPETSIRQ